MEKRVGLFLSVGIFFVLINSILVCAINLDVSIRPVSENFITEFNETCIYDIVITNNEKGDYFDLYSTVGIDISPQDKIFIGEKETKTVRVTANPQQAIRESRGYSPFEYLIRNSKGEIQKERLIMNILSLKDAFTITSRDIDPLSQSTVVGVKNAITREFENVELKMDSPFFNYETTLSLKPLEEKSLDITLDPAKLKTLTAGKYIITAQINSNGKAAQKEIIFNYLEQENIESSSQNTGLLIKKTEIIRKNSGNVNKNVVISIQKNLFTYLFTTVNIAPTKSEISGIYKNYIWEKQLAPNEQLYIQVKTNWLYPILIVIFLAVLVLLIYRFLQTDITVKKKVYYVKTKGGEFALGVHVNVRARRFVERIKIVDRIPPLVMLYDKFGAISPDRIDLVNKRLEWNVEALNPGEERVFSYIIYSKIGVVGKFELPPTRAVYEREGEMKEASSNKSFFINRPKHNRM